MTTLGDILLKFGATGADGEAPLRFTTAHINLLVGPNNAGKSLMLREVSGVNPRSPRKRAWDEVEYEPTVIVEAVHWGEDIARSLQQEVVTDIFAVNESAWDELKLKSWDQLLPALEVAVPRLVEVRDRLCMELMDFSTVIIPDGLDVLKDLAVEAVRADTRGFSSLVIGGAVVLLQMSSMAPVVIDSGSMDGSPPVVQRAGPLTPEQTAAISNVIETAWASCEQVFGSLGVDMTGLSLAALLDRNSIGGALIQEIAKNPYLKRLLTREQGLLEHLKPTEEAIEQMRRLAVIGGWVLDPEPLMRLAKRLREDYAEQTWANPGRRAHDAKSALFLDGMARLNVTRSAKLTAFGKDNDEQPAILALLKDPEQMGLLRDLTEDALGGYLVLDMTSEAPQVVWRVAKDVPPEGIETRFTADAEQYHKTATRLEGRSDGIHAFVGMLAAILAKPADLVFIDEPEAFLHPPLVRQMARHLSMLARSMDTQFFIATHSADLLEAFAASGSEVNIIRLTHDETRSTARLLRSDDVRHQARDPLLRSEATLSALFHDGAVICEAAGDRVLYMEINERLLAGDDEKGLDSCVFLNAQNWSTIPRMMAPLRRMGVAAAAVVDSDVLFDKGLTFVLDAAQVDKILRDGWLQQRNGLRDRLAERLGLKIEMTEPAPESSKRKKKKQNEGLALKRDIIAKFTPDERKIFEALRKSMAEYGVFVVPVGELEDWMTPLGLSPPPDDKKKGRWLQDALKRLGTDPESDDYVRPGDGDIWEFMREVNAWIQNPNREGTAPGRRVEDGG